MPVSYKKLRVLYRKLRYSYGRMPLPRVPDEPEFSPEALAPKNRTLPSVGTFLPRRLQLQVQLALGRQAEIFQARSAEELDRLIKKRPLGAVILDPGLEGLSESDFVVRLFTKYPSLPVIAYVTLEPASFTAVARLSRFGLEHVVLHRQDDSPDRFKAMLEAATADPLVRRVMESLRPQLEELPLALAIALGDLFEEPHRFHSAQHVNYGTGYSTLQMYQSFSTAQLASPKTFVIAARALRAFSYLRDRGYSVMDVAEKLGYRQPRILTEHSQKVFGLTLAKARRRMTPEQAVTRVLRFVRASEGGASAEPKKRKKASA
jgi:AraC-like DNA-binding protein